MLMVKSKICSTPSTNVSGTPDAVNYVGKMDGDNNLVNKLYVDDKMAELLANSN